MSQDTPPKEPGERTGDTPAEDTTAPIPLESRENAPPQGAGRARIDAPSLIDDFDEDADFDSDPELERVVKGIPVGGSDRPSDHPTGTASERLTGEPLCASGAWKVPAAVGAVVTLTAAVFAGVYADHTVWAFVLLTIYRALLHTGTGVGALVIASILLCRKVGSFEGAAARMGLCVSMFLVVYSLDIPITLGKAEEALLAAAAYFGAIVVSFRLAPRDAALVGGAHFIVAMLLWAGGLLSNAIQAGSLAAGTGG